MIPTSKKDEFLDACKVQFGGGLDGLFEGAKKDPQGRALWFSNVLNEHPHLRALFREAVKEAEAEAANPAAGLANLFGDM